MNNYKSSESISALLATPRTTPNLSSTSALRDWSTLWLACALIGPKFAGWEGPGRRSLFSRLRPKFGTVSRRRRQCAHGGYDTVTVRRLTSTDERRRRRVHFALWLAVPGPVAASPSSASHAHCHSEILQPAPSSAHVLDPILYLFSFKYIYNGCFFLIVSPPQLLSECVARYVIGKSVFSFCRRISSHWWLLKQTEGKVINFFFFVAG